MESTMFICDVISWFSRAVVMFQRKVLISSLSCIRRQQVPLKHWYVSTRQHCILLWSGWVSKQASEQMVQKVRQ